ncbi:hypothetical protein HPB48_026459 [Haemaphysalis longicornis]|uniref:Uncharacterized protein n=1 Tax=Haemaphysalis longicornis TaxID=44386 RepID=A0A9J6H9T1_HAELO|nr:hypothetical protein HPB48_026459 [Haemaphysalis longicornis]
MFFPADEAPGSGFVFDGGLGSGSHLGAALVAASRLWCPADIRPVSHRVTTMTGGDSFLVQSHRDALVVVEYLAGNQFLLEDDHSDVAAAKPSHRKNFAVFLSQLGFERSRRIIGIDGDDPFADVACVFAMSPEGELGPSPVSGTSPSSRRAAGSELSPHTTTFCSPHQLHRQFHVPALA